MILAIRKDLSAGIGGSATGRGATARSLLGFASSGITAMTVNENAYRHDGSEPDKERGSESEK
jgi:hypothetical protein